MRFAGIDVGSRAHVAAVVDEEGRLVAGPGEVAEDAEGHERLKSLLGAPQELLVVMEATGHYWWNVFASLTAQGYGVAVVNPLATRRHAESELSRTKTDALDAQALARFARERRPSPNRIPDAELQELRDLVRLRDRFVQEQGDAVRRLHRAADVSFPEIRRIVPDLGTRTAWGLLAAYPTAAAMRTASPRRLASLRADGLRPLGRERAEALVEAARVSVGSRQGAAQRLEVETLCEDLIRLHERLALLEKDIEERLDRHELGRLLQTIEGVAAKSAARVIAELGDPAEFRSADALASYVGVVPHLRHSGRRTPERAGISPLGHARLRSALWMPVLCAVRHNPWLRGHYQRLLARGKLRKVALIACMRKLLHAIYSVARTRRPFVPILTPKPVEAFA